MNIPAALIRLAFGLFSSAADNAEPVETEAGRFLFAYPLVTKVFFVLLLLGSLVGIVLMLLYIPIRDQSDVDAAIYLSLFWCAFAVYFYIEMFTVKVWAGPDGIEATSGWRGRRQYAWREVSSVTYSRLSMWFKISVAGKAPIRVHGWITGIDKFQQLYMTHLPRETWQAAFDSAAKDHRIPRPLRG